MFPTGNIAAHCTRNSEPRITRIARIRNVRASYPCDPCSPWFVFGCGRTSLVSLPPLPEDAKVTFQGKDITLTNVPKGALVRVTTAERGKRLMAINIEVRDMNRR